MREPKTQRIIRYLRGVIAHLTEAQRREVVNAIGSMCQTKAERWPPDMLTCQERLRFRRWLWWLYGPDCAYCGRGFPMEGLTIDHIQPRSKGGAVRDIKNMALACLGCNREKGNKWEVYTIVK